MKVAFFRPSPGVSAEEFALRQTSYRQTYRHVDPRRPETFMLDANPQKPDRPGWLGHRINDGASLSPESDEAAMVEYYAATGKARNVCAVALCVPLVGFVTTKPIAADSEVFATYGHSYWTRSAVYEAGAQAAELAEASALRNREKDLWQVATDKKYGQAIKTLGGLISQTSAEMLEGDEGEDDELLL